MNKLRWIWVCLAFLAAVETFAADETPLAHRYGFLAPEIFKLDSRINNLLVRDIRGDGVNGIVVVNNSSNRIDLLEQRSGDETPQKLDVNELPNDKRMGHRKIPVPRTVSSLELKDVNNDGLPDLVYIGDPAGLYVEYQQKDGSFQRGRTFNVDAQTSSWTLDVGDVNGNGRNDVVVLGKQNLYVLYQDDSGRLKDPKQFRLSEGKASLLRILDLDGDGANDIVYLSDDKELPVRVRFQTKDGGLGPERRFEIDPPRGVAYADVDGKPGQNLLMISSLSGRLLVYGLDREGDDDSEVDYQLVTYPFEKTGSSPQNDIAIADFTGDGRLDVVTGDSESARLILYRHEGADDLGNGQSYPGMLGAGILRAIETGDGPAKLLSLSVSEKAIGLSRYDGSRLTFPELLPTRDEPLAMETQADDDGAVRVYYVSRAQDAQRRREGYILRGLVIKPDQSGREAEPLKFKDSEEIELQLQSRPTDLRMIDVNFDGHADLMVFFLYQPPVVLVSDGEGSFTPLSESTQSALGTVGSPAVYYGPFMENGRSLLVAQRNFSRSMKLDADSRWRVIDQFNASETSANVTGVAVLDVDGDDEPELAMYDRTSSSLVILKKIDEIYRRWRTVKVGAFDVRGMRTADLDSNGRDDLILFDTNKMSVLYNGRQDARLKQIASYETDLPQGRLFDVAPGDLNGDGRTDLLILEPVAHYLEIVTSDEENKLQRALRWQVFEEKTFGRSLGRGGMEPREMAIGDVNGDGLDDIAVLVHDRVLIYLQDDGRADGEETTAGKQ